MKIKFITAAAAMLLLLKTAEVKAQFNDYFTTGTPWTLVGSGVYVGSGWGNFNNTATGGDNRMYRFLSPTDACLNNTSWTVDVDFRPNSISTAGAKHTVLSLTNGIENPYMNVNGGAYTGQDFVEIQYFATSSLAGNQRLRIGVKDGATPAVSSIPFINAPVGVTYYLRLSKSGGTVTLSAYTTAARTTHIAGSPVSMATLGSFDNLNVLQFGSICETSSAPQQLSGWIDNISIPASSLVRGCSCGYWDDYSVATGWTQQGTTVSVTGGVVDFANTPDGGYQSRRVYKSIGSTISSIQSWAADFEFRATAVGDGGPGHVLLALTAGTLDPNADQTTYTPTNQDAMMVTWASSNATNQASTFLLKGVGKDGTATTSSSGFVIAVGVTYYIRLERLDATHARISAFSDAGRTVHVAGSPECFTVSSGISGLTHMQHGNSVTGNITRALTGTVDNTCIKPLDAPNGGIVSGPDYICSPASVTLDNVEPATGGLWSWTYQWEQSSNCLTWGAVSGATSLSYVTPTLTSARCYRRKATGPCGIVVYSNVISVEVYYPLDPTITATGFAACDDNGLLTASVPAAASAGVSYTWSTGQTGAVLPVNVTGPVTYTVTASNACYSATQTQYLEPCYHPTGAFPLLVAQTDFCVNWSGTSGSEYFWIMDNTMAPGAGPAYNASEGTLRIFNRWDNGLLYEQHLVASCGGFWNGIFVWNGIYAGAPVQPDSYIWTFELRNCGTNVGSYQGFVVVTGTCRVADPSLAENADSVAGEITGLNIFPNPGDGVFTVNFEAASPAGTMFRTIQVTNALGQIVKEEQVSSSQLRAQVDLSGEASGVYFFRITDGDQSKQIRVIKQ